MRVLIYTLFIFISMTAFGLDSIEFEVEALVREGKLNTAVKKVLDSKLSGFDQAKLLGLIKLKEKDFDSASKHFKKYLSLKKDDLRIRNFYVQALLQNKNFKLAQNELSKVPKKERDLKWSLLSSMVMWEGKNRSNALSFLYESKNKYKSELIPRQIYFFLSELSLFESIISESSKDINSNKYTFDLGLYVITLLKKANDFQRADMYFEFLSAKFNKSPKLLRERGLYEVERGRLLSGAEFLAKSASLDNEYVHEAAEVFLKVKNYSRALFFNRKVLDPLKKTVQLFTIYLENDEYNKAAGLYYNLAKTGGLENQRVAYALSYVGFKLKDYRLFDKAFEKVVDPNLYTKVLVLKKKVEDCKSFKEIECEFI